MEGKLYLSLQQFFGKHNVRQECQGRLKLRPKWIDQMSPSYVPTMTDLIDMTETFLNRQEYRFKLIYLPPIDPYFRIVLEEGTVILTIHHTPFF